MDVAIVVVIVDAAAAVIVAAIAADAVTFVVAAAVSKHCHHHFQPVGFAHFDFHWVILLSININITEYIFFFQQKYIKIHLPLGAGP